MVKFACIKEHCKTIAIKFHEKVIFTTGRMTSAAEAEIERNLKPLPLY